jgi:hypothetical protein
MNYFPSRSNGLKSVEDLLAILIAKRMLFFIFR